MSDTLLTRTSDESWHLAEPSVIVALPEWIVKLKKALSLALFRLHIAAETP